MRPPIRAFLRLLPLLVMTSSCRDKSKAAQPQADPVKHAPAPSQPPVIEPVVPTPVILAKAIDAGVASPLGEAAVVLLSEGVQKTVRWNRGDKVSILIEASWVESAEEPLRSDAKIVANIGGEKSELFSCKGLKKQPSLRVEALRRGPFLHVLCITPPSDLGKGATNAIRLRYSPADNRLVQSGTYSGEGIVDPDTIELDEGTLGEGD